MSKGCSPAIVITAPPCGPKPRKSRSKMKKCYSPSPRRKSSCKQINGNGGKSNGDSGGNGDRKKNFMEEVWKVMTPDMLNKLVDILVQDFHLSREEACMFINQQRETAKVTQKAASGKCPCGPDMVPAIPNMDVRNFMIKEFIEVVASKLSDYMALVLTARKGTRIQDILTENINSGVDGFLGISESSQLGKVVRYFSSKVALWLDNKLDESYDCSAKDSAKNNNKNNDTNNDKNNDNVDAKSSNTEE